MKRKKEPKTLGERIRFLREDMTQSEFADILRIKQAMISRYEADKETPSPKVLLRIGQFSARSIEWLLTGQELSTPGAKGTKAKSLAAKTSRSLTREDMVDVAAGHLRDTRLPEVDEFVQMTKDLFKDRKKMRKVLDYFRYLRFEENAGSRK